MKLILYIFLILFLYEISWVVFIDSSLVSYRKRLQSSDPQEFLGYWASLAVIVLIIIALILSTKSFWLLLLYQVFSFSYYSSLDKLKCSSKSFSYECGAQSIVYFVCFFLEVGA